MQGVVRNTRDPSARPESGQARSYKPKAKSRRVQRESEGIVVLKGAAQAEPAKAVRHNAAGGKGPCGGHAEGAGKREGMAGQTGPKDPGGEQPSDKVRQLQRQLWAAAKRAPARRFHALYGQMCRDDVLHEAWRRVRRNRGAAGIDRMSIQDVEQHGEQRFLQELGEVLRAGEYGAQVVRRVYIPKGDGGRRPLGIPTVRDRVVQMAALLVLQPIFEADFQSCSYGFRPKRSAAMALERVRQLGNQGAEFVLDADIGVISPLLSNIYLHVLDRVWARHGTHLGTLVRYADDFVVMCRRAQDCEEAQGRIERVLDRLGLKLHPEKTRRVVLSNGYEGFDFLGCHVRKRMSGRLLQQKGLRRYYVQRWPSRKAMNRVRERVRQLTPRGRCNEDVRGVIAQINPVLRGWGQYFRSTNAANHFIDVDDYVVRRLKGLRIKRAGRNLRAGQAQRWDRQYFEQLGLYRLRGTIRYAGPISWPQEYA